MDLLDWSSVWVFLLFFLLLSLDFWYTENINNNRVRIHTSVQLKCSLFEILNGFFQLVSECPAAFPHSMLWLDIDRYWVFCVIPSNTRIVCSVSTLTLEKMDLVTSFSSYDYGDLWWFKKQTNQQEKKLPLWFRMAKIQSN